jgi:hypothetical protein
LKFFNVAQKTLITNFQSPLLVTKKNQSPYIAIEFFLSPKLVTKKFKHYLKKIRQTIKIYLGSNQKKKVVGSMATINWTIKII